MTGCRASVRAAAALAGPAGAATLAVVPLLGPGAPFDAALRMIVWAAVVVAASSGAGRPAALFGLVATVVEISVLATVRDGAAGSVWSPVVAVVTAAALAAARHGPSPGRVIARLQATNHERPGTGAA
jgi:hypothetical protein